MSRHIAARLLVAGCWLLVVGFQFAFSTFASQATQPKLPARSTLPQFSPNAGPIPASAPALAAHTELFVGQGFDTCEVPSAAALQTWFLESPYRAVNLYIGGVGRYCSNRALNAELVARLGEIGWKFIPTWVGLQAPCYTGRKPPMNADPAISYAQGVAEASAAIQTAIDLGLALPDGSGAIIYYDMEAYDSHLPACDDPVRAFISGWTGELHARGSDRPRPDASFSDRCGSSGCVGRQRHLCPPAVAGLIEDFTYDARIWRCQRTSPANFRRSALF